MINLIFLLAVFLNVSGPEFWCENPRTLNWEMSIRERDVINIMRTIKIIESGGNYYVRGHSGEYGAYQYQRDTWRRYSLQLTGEVLPMTEANQDLVTMLKVKQLYDRGYSVEQIASVWNSGRVSWHGKRGINRWGQRYDVPRYVRNFVGIYNKRA